MGDWLHSNKEDEGEKTFLRITNRDIWSKLEKIEQNLENFKIVNEEGHAAIMKKQDRTNGNVIRNKLKISFNRKLIYIIGVAILTMSGWIYAMP